MDPTELHPTNIANFILQRTHILFICHGGGGILINKEPYFVLSFSLLEWQQQVLEMELDIEAVKVEK